MGILLGFLCGSHAIPCYFYYDLSMGFLWDSCGVSMIFLWSFYGITIECQLKVN